MSDKSDFSGDLTAGALTPGMTLSERRRVLKERVQRHVDHLDALVQNMKELGVDNASINARVAEVFEQYKAQLLRNIDLTGRAIGGQKNTAPNSPQEKPDPASAYSSENGDMPRVAKTGEQLEEIVLQHLRTRPETAGVASVSVGPCSEGHGGWTVKAFQEGTSTRGGCLQGLHGILPVLQKQFTLVRS